MTAEARSGSGILKVYKAQVLPGNAAEQLVDALSRHPDLVADALRSLHRNRTPLASGDYPDDFTRMAASLRMTYDPVAAKGNKRIWRDVFRSQLLEVYVDIVTNDAFFFEPQGLIDDVFDGLAYLSGCMIGAAPDIDENAVLARSSHVLWKHIWENRHLLRVPRDEADTFRARGNYVGGSIATLHMSYAMLVAKLDVDSLQSHPPTYISQVGLYLFSTSKSSFLNQYRLISPFSRLGEAHIHRPRFILRMFREVFPQDESSHDLFDRVNWCISHAGQPRPDLTDPLGNSEFLSCVRLMSTIGSIPEIAPVIEHHSVLRTALVALQGYRYSAVMPTLAYESVLVLFNLFSAAFLHNDSFDVAVTISGSDVVPLLACGLETVASGGIPEYAMRMILHSNLDEYATAAARLAIEIDIAPRHRGLLKGLQAGAKDEWWPTMRLIQHATPCNSFINQSEIQVFAQKWAALGTALGLDATKERQRHEREMRRHCSWRGCQYHKEELTEERLKVCAGCGDTRYCGRDCQKSDWTKGSHKQRCRRLK